MNGLEIPIDKPEDALEIARKEPEKALALAIWKLVKMERHCACRKEDCRKKFVSVRAAKWFAISTVAVLIAYSIGIGILTWEDIIKASAGKIIP